MTENNKVDFTIKHMPQPKLPQIKIKLPDDPNLRYERHIDLVLLKLQELRKLVAESPHWLRVKHFTKVHYEQFWQTQKNLQGRINAHYQSFKQKLQTKIQKHWQPLRDKLRARFTTTMGKLDARVLAFLDKFIIKQKPK